MTPKNIQDVVAEKVEELKQLLWEIDRGEIPGILSRDEILCDWLTTTLTQLVKEVEAGAKQDAVWVAQDVFGDIDFFWEKMDEYEKALTPPTSDEDKVHGVIIGNE